MEAGNLGWMSEKAEEWLSKVEAITRRLAKRRFIQWQKDEQNKGVHKYVKAAHRTMPIPGELLVDGQVIADPNRLADHHAGQWMKHWAGEHAEKNLAHTVVEMDMLLKDAREEPRMEKINGEMVRQALYTFDDRTGQGADHTGPLFY